MKFNSIIIIAVRMDGFLSWTMTTIIEKASVAVAVCRPAKSLPPSLIASPLAFVLSHTTHTYHMIDGCSFIAFWMNANRRQLITHAIRDSPLQIDMTLNIESVPKQLLPARREPEQTNSLHSANHCESFGGESVLRRRLVSLSSIV